MKNSVKVNPFSCRCKLSTLVSHLKQMNGMAASKSHNGSNRHQAEAQFVRYI